MRTLHPIVLTASLLAGCAPVWQGSPPPDAAPEQAASPAPPAAPPHDTTRIPLAWRPSRELHPTTRLAWEVFGERAVEVRPFVDLRGEPQLVGKNLERAPFEHLFVTSDDGAAWVTQCTRTILQTAQVNVVASGGTVVIGGAVKKMMVVETDRYRSTLVLQVTVQDAAGHLLYQREVVGLADNWGRSLLDRNYHEALSDAVVDAVEQFLRDDALKAAAGRAI